MDDYSWEALRPESIAREDWDNLRDFALRQFGAHGDKITFSYMNTHKAFVDEGILRRSLRRLRSRLRTARPEVLKESGVTFCNAEAASFDKIIVRGNGKVRFGKGAVLSNVIIDLSDGEELIIPEGWTIQDSYFRGNCRFEGTRGFLMGGVLLSREGDSVESLENIVFQGRSCISVIPVVGNRQVMVAVPIKAPREFLAQLSFDGYNQTQLREAMDTLSNVRKYSLLHKLISQSMAQGFPASMPAADRNTPQRRADPRERSEIIRLLGGLKALEGIDFEIFIEPCLPRPAEVESVGGRLYLLVNPNFLRAPPEQLRIAFEGHELFHLLNPSASEEEARSYTLDFLKKNGLLKEHIDFLAHNDIGLKAESDWLNILGKQSFIEVTFDKGDIGRNTYRLPCSNNADPDRAAGEMAAGIYDLLVLNSAPRIIVRCASDEFARIVEAFGQIDIQGKIRDKIKLVFGQPLEFVYTKYSVESLDVPDRVLWHLEKMPSLDRDDLFLGINIGSTYTRCVLMKGDTIIAQDSRILWNPHRMHHNWARPATYEEFLDGVTGFIGSTVNAAKVDINKVKGVGVAMVGFVREGRVVAKAYVTRGMPDDDFVRLGNMQEDLKRRLGGVPVCVEIDSKVTALGERCVSGAKNALVVKIGTAMGGKMIDTN
jgi:hypothetical protein